MVAVAIENVRRKAKMCWVLARRWRLLRHRTRTSRSSPWTNFVTHFVLSHWPNHKRSDRICVLSNQVEWRPHSASSVHGGCCLHQRAVRSKAKPSEVGRGKPTFYDVCDGDQHHKEQPRQKCRQQGEQAASYTTSTVYLLYAHTKYVQSKQRRGNSQLTTLLCLISWMISSDMSGRMVHSSVKSL